MTSDRDQTALPDDVADVLSARWGVTITGVVHVHGELDRTYRVSTPQGLLSVKSRLIDGQQGTDDVDFELAVLAALEVGGVPVPRIRRDRSGAAMATAAEGSIVWVLDWVEGRLWSSLAHRPPGLLRELGSVAHRSVRALANLEHPASSRTHHWDVRTADASLRAHGDEVSSPRQREIVDCATRRFVERVIPRIGGLSTGVVHQDLNDHNLIVGGRKGFPEIVGVLDPGDALHSVVISELAIAVAYAMLRTRHPLDAACDVVRGWCDVGPISRDEIECVFPMAMARLGVNATTWAHRGARGQRSYAAARSEHTWSTLELLVEIHPDVAATALALATGDDPPVRAVVGSPDHRRPALGTPPTVIDLDPHRELFDEVDPTDCDAVAAATPKGLRYMPHLAVRLDRGGPADGHGGPATVQVGGIVRAEERFTLSLPYAGMVRRSTTGQLIVEHDAGLQPWWSVWDGVEPAIAEDEQVAAGVVIGSGSDVHVRLLVLDPCDADEPLAIPAFVRPTERDVWAHVSPDPAMFLGIPSPAVDASGWLDGGAVVRLRAQRLASSQRSYYVHPMNLVRARRTWFVDDHAHHYLDAINNVAHVGHGHPHVVDAAQRQMRRLNTNSRFVYEEMARYADRLAATLPDPLEVVFLVCTGSEANDLALRISRQVTGRDDVIVIEGAYHGNTTAVTGISPNRYRGSGGAGPPATTHEAVQPNMYRGPYSAHPEAATRYAEHVGELVGRLTADGRPPAAFIAESLMGTAGQIVHPREYLTECFGHVRGAGGLCISDEVQVGFGRLGHHFWGFELDGVVPDIVTMGKPMGNGHPVAALVTTREIADAFDTGMKYFNTFGGNPVSCAIAGAVLDVIEDEQLQAHARQVGGLFRERLRELMNRHEHIGDVRGEGLYIGVELVDDRATKQPAADLTTAVSERMRERGTIVYPNGDLGNVLKIKPPMVITADEVDRFVDQLDRVLAEL